MRFWRAAGVLVLVAALGGCVSASQKAHQMAEQNLYQEVQYANAAQQGPTVAVLPGLVVTPSYEFRSRVSAAVIRDFAEAEMGKCNFKVQDRSEDQARFQEIAVAANLGNASVLSKFKKYKMTPPQWLVVYDIVQATPRSTGFKHLDKQMAGMAGALMGAMLLGETGAKMGGAMMSSISSAEESREWTIVLRYRILDGATGEQVQEAQFTDTTTIYREIKGFMGFDQKEAGGGQLSKSVQTLVQTAIKDIDEKHKLPALAQAEEMNKQHVKLLAKAQPEAEPKKGKKGAPAVGPDVQVACAPATIGGIACQLPTAWGMGKIPTVREVALAKNPNIALLEDKKNPGKKNPLAESLMLQSAGPIVAMSAPGGPLAGAGGVALSGPGVEGRVFVLPGQAGKADPAAIQANLEKYFQQASLSEGLGVEVVEKGDLRKPVIVYKYIVIERRKVEKDSGPNIGADEKQDDNTKMVSIPHYCNLAVSIVPKGNDLVLAMILVPEDQFIPQLDAFKVMVGSIG